MRTRRSPRNQAILWRALTPPVAVAVPVPVVLRCWDCDRYAPGGRARGECVLLGVMVSGRSQRPCFQARK